MLGKEDDGSDSVYIGEFENMKNKLVQRIRVFNAEKKKFEGNTAVIFTDRDLKTSIRYLENELVEITEIARRCKVLTKNTCANIVIKESQKAVMEEFRDDIKILLEALGYKVLEMLVDSSILDNTSNDDLLYFSGNDFRATAIETSDGFVALKGSKIRARENASISQIVSKHRKELIDFEKVKDDVLTEDGLFAGLSAAAMFSCGRSASGPKSWKNKDGILLKDLQAVADY